MKAIKSLVITSAIAASLAGSAFANSTVIVHVVGAPAFRQPVNDAIETVVESFGSTAGLTATSASSVPVLGKRLQGSTIESAKQNQWLIPNFESGVNLEINASFTGSAAGVESVAGGGGANNGVQLVQPFIPDSDATTTNIGSTAPVVVSSSALVNAVPDNNWITASDTFQGSTLFNGIQTFYAASGQSSPFTFNYQPLTADLNGSPGGVEVYHWVASPNAPSDFTNITTAQANLLYTEGKLPLSFFTGVAADDSKTVYALSRDPGSGSRIIALSEIGVQPPGTNATIKTYVPTVTANGTKDGSGNYVGGTITANALAPAGTIPSTNIYEPQGDTGYANFGSKTNGGLPAAADATSNYVGLLQVITAAPQSSNQIFVTYLDNDDTAEAVAAGTSISSAGVSGGSAKLLTYNGVSALTTDGVNDPAVSEGEYTFWSYESFLAPSGQGSTAADFEGQVESAFPTFAALPAADLDVNRSTDSGPISHN